MIVIDKTKIPRGPRFIKEPNNTVFDLSSELIKQNQRNLKLNYDNFVGRSQMNYISLRCVADGYPTPTYKWYKEEYEENRLKAVYIDPLSDTRITQTDGTLTIHNPQQTSDRGKYHCIAENQFGRILSQTVSLTFGCKNYFNSYFIFQFIFDLMLFS